MNRSGQENGVGDGLGALTVLRCPGSGRELRLRRAWPRQPGHLLLDYRDGGSSVAGQWFADRARLQAVAEQTAAMTPDGVSVDGALGVMLQRHGADRRLPALAEIVADEGATLIVHRPERRAVVRRTRSGATTYLKVVRPGRALPGLADLPGVRVPEVVAAEPRRGTVEHTELAGRTLHEILGDPADAGVAAVAPAFHAAGRAVRALHSAPAPPGPAAHGPDAEVALAARWVDHALAHGAFDGEARSRAADALSAVREGVGALVPPGAGALLHRDLHDKQVLVAEGDDAGLLDLDTLAVGDAALDVANLLVHLELRTLQGHCRGDVAGAAGDAFLAGYRPDRALQERLGAYAGATRLRLACVYAFRPRWQDVAPCLLAEGPRGNYSDVSPAG